MQIDVHCHEYYIIYFGDGFPRHDLFHHIATWEDASTHRRNELRLWTALDDEQTGSLRRRRFPADEVLAMTRLANINVENVLSVLCRRGAGWRDDGNCIWHHVQIELIAPNQNSNAYQPSWFLSKAPFTMILSDTALARA